MQREDIESWDPFPLDRDSAFTVFQVFLGVGQIQAVILNFDFFELVCCLQKHCFILLADT